MSAPKSPTSVIDQEEGPPPEEDEQEKLKWRGLPELTFSDWRIEVVHEDKVDVYHVHRFVLAYGARRSEYFARLFQSGFQEAQECCSRIELEPLAAVAFPALLDYLYNSERPLTINTETATALHSLGDYFEIRRLRWDAKQFCSQDLSLETAWTYHRQSKELHNDTVYRLLVRFLSQNIMEINPESTIVEKSDPQMWLEVINLVQRGEEEAGSSDSDEEEDEAFSLHFSQIVARTNWDEHAMDWDAFRQLTKAETLPHVDPDFALLLMSWNDCISSKGVEVGDEDSPGETLRSAESSCLQQRCAEALSKNWRKILSSGGDGTFLRLGLTCQEPKFLVHLLVESLMKSRVELEDCRHQLRMALAEQEELRKARATIASLQKQVKQQVMAIGDLRIERDSLKATLSSFYPFPKGAPLTDHKVPFPEELKGKASHFGGLPIAWQSDVRDRPIFVYWPGRRESLQSAWYEF